MMYDEENYWCDVFYKLVPNPTVFLKELELDPRVGETPFHPTLSPPPLISCVDFVGEEARVFRILCVCVVM